MILSIANHFKDYLPIYLPFTFAMLSIIAGIATERIKLSFGELLKVHGDMILGLFSFVTWGLVTYFQAGRVQLNQKYFIDVTHIFLLLLFNFGLLLVSIIALRHDWTKGKVAGFLSFLPGYLKNWVNGFVLMVCCFVALFPFFLKQDLSSASKDSIKNREFLVVVPFKDQSLVDNLGEYRWKSRILCVIEEVMAQTEDEAKKKAVDKFQRSDFAVQIISPPRKKGDTTSKNPVEIISDRIVISETR